MRLCVTLVVVVTLNVDGTMTRFDFPGRPSARRYSQMPTETLFASGGSRGELSQVAPDGCLYVTQVGTRFADGTASVSDASIVPICGGFIPAAGLIPPIQLTPWGAVRPVRTEHTVAATVLDNKAGVGGLTIEFEVIAGPNTGDGLVGVTDPAGVATFTYVGDGGEGVDQVQAWLEDETRTFYSNIATTTWGPLECSLDCNTNRIPEECELEGSDQNGDEIPDDCNSDR